MSLKCPTCGQSYELKSVEGPEKLPPYLIRPDDLAIFSLNNDAATYSGHQGKVEFPASLHHQYSYQRLTKLGFYFVKGLSLEKSDAS